MVTARFVQLVYQEDEDISFADTAEPARHFSYLPAELRGRRDIELQDGQELAKAA
jgi:hypothetical protein